MGKKEYQQNLHNPAKLNHDKANRMLHRNEGDRLGSWRRASPTVTAVRHARRPMSDHRGRSGAGAVPGANWLVPRLYAERATKGDTASSSIDSAKPPLFVAAWRDKDVSKIYGRHSPDFRPYFNGVAAT